MNPCILVVDDNATNLKLAAAILESEGYEVHQARDAATALRCIEAANPQLVLLDIQLPSIDGLALTRIIKADERSRHIKVVAVSAYAMKSDETNALAAGCDGFITKPIDVASFPGDVARYIRVGE